MNFLACDLGGTKVLMAIYEEVSKNSSPKLIAKERYLSSEWDSIYVMYQVIFDLLYNYELLSCNHNLSQKLFLEPSPPVQDN